MLDTFEFTGNLEPNATLTALHSEVLEFWSRGSNDRLEHAGSGFGEPIRRDIPLQVHTVQSGETLREIATAHLGPNPSRAEINQHMQEIASQNGIRTSATLRAGQDLTLPGHTRDGGFITGHSSQRRTIWSDGTERIEGKWGDGYVRRPDGSEHHWGPTVPQNYDVLRTADGGIRVTTAEGTIRTTWDNGAINIHRPDGTGHFRNPQVGGGYFEHHWGRLPEQNYDLIHTTDGRYLMVEPPGSAPRDLTEAPEIRVQHARVSDLAATRNADGDALSRLRADMERFEQRGRARGISKEEIARTYQEVQRILEATGDSPLTADQRTVIAQQIIANAATPTNIDQGQHGTCNVTSLEARMYTRQPSAAARLIADVVTSAQFISADGPVIRPDIASLQPDVEALANPPRYGQRGHASQIFQITAVNTYWSRQPGNIRYSQVPAESPSDSGERLMNYSTNPPRECVDRAGRPVRNPGLDAQADDDLYRQISGRNEPPFEIKHAGCGSGSGFLSVNSEQELSASLLHMQQENRLPAVVQVHTRHEPFWTDSRGATAGGSGGWHVLTVTAIDPTTGRVSVDNQWGEATDHLSGNTISLGQLYASMIQPGGARCEPYERPH